MNLNRKFTGARRGPVLGVIITVLLGLFFLMTPLGDWLRLRSYDFLFFVRPSTDRAALEDVVILSMDEASQDILKQDADRPWDRAIHTRLLRELTARGARLVVFDVLWDKPSTNRVVDEELAAAIHEHGRVVLAAHWRSPAHENLPVLQEVVRPANPIGTNAPWGLVEWPISPGTSQTIRRQFYHPSHPTLAWQAAVALNQAPPNRAMTYWLNYYGPGAFQTVSYHRVFASNALASNFFAGKTVFVGKSPVITAQGQSLEMFPTPYSLWPGGLTPGVEIEATAFLNLVRREWLEEMAPGPELLLVLVFGVVFGGGLSLMRPWTAGALALAGTVLVAAGSALLTWGWHLWFPWLVVCVVQIPAALAWAALAHTKRVDHEKETLQRDVALGESVAALPELWSRSASENSAVTVRTTSAPAPTAPRAGEAAPPPPIPNHQLLQRIGRGAYGEVWLARDDIGTYHAVKVVSRRSFGRADPYEREFRGIQKFTPISRSHPGFVHILHVGRNDAEGYFFYIMELGDDEQHGQRIDPATYVANTLARQLQKRKRIPLPESVQLGLALAGALDYLHQLHLIHRDIKPSNIIFVNGAPKFADVGLVTDITAKGTTFLGTEGYIAPEGPGSPAADVFSLGMVLYEASTGRDRRDFPALPATLVEQPGKELARFNAVILKACEPDARQRFATAAEFRARLAELAAAVQ